VVPGVPNLHLHAFQRAMAGLAERAGRAGDSFWGWASDVPFSRAAYADEVQAIAAQFMLKFLLHGYTSVAEFHYLHNAPEVLRMTTARNSPGVLSWLPKRPASASRWCRCCIAARSSAGAPASVAPAAVRDGGR